MTSEAPDDQHINVQIHWSSEERKHHWTERFYWILTAILTFGAVLGALATVIISQLSLREARKATDEAKTATAEAHRQADAAEKQVEVTQNTAEQQLRSYVIINTMVNPSTGNEVENVKLNGLAEFNLLIRDVGQTPVYDFVIHATEAIATEPTATSWDNCSVIYTLPGSAPQFFGKETSNTLPGKNPFTQAQIDSITQGDNKIIVAGRACYQDVFKKQRWTDFCFLWGWDKDKNTLGKSEFCKVGNGADH
jgi:hypothetical protein